MQLQNIQLAVRDQMGLPTDDGVLTDTVLTRLINRALEVFSARADWPWLEAATTQVSADASVAFPADTIRILSIRVDGEVFVMKPISTDMADELSVATTAAGTSPYYALQGLNFLPRPAPTGSTTYAIRYLLKEPAALSSPTDEPTTPDAWIQAVIELTVAFGYRQIRNAPMADHAERRYETLVEEAKERLSMSSASEGGGRMANDRGEPDAT